MEAGRPQRLQTTVWHKAASWTPAGPKPRNKNNETTASGANLSFRNVPKEAPAVSFALICTPAHEPCDVVDDGRPNDATKQSQLVPFQRRDWNLSDLNNRANTPPVLVVAAAVARYFKPQQPLRFGGFTLQRSCQHVVQHGYCILTKQTCMFKHSKVEAFEFLSLPKTIWKTWKMSEIRCRVRHELN